VRIAHTTRLYGYNMTRAYTLAARQAGYQGVLSVGRVQTPILSLLIFIHFDSPSGS